MTFYGLEGSGGERAQSMQGTGTQSHYLGFKLFFVFFLRSDILHFFEIGHFIFFFSPTFFEIGQGFMRHLMVAIPNIIILRGISPPIRDRTDFDCGVD